MSRLPEFSIVIVLVLMLVLEWMLSQIEHEHEHDYDYEVAWTMGLPTFPARERQMAPRRSAHLVLLSGAKSANEVVQITNQRTIR